MNVSKVVLKHCNTQLPYYGYEKLLPRSTLAGMKSSFREHFQLMKLIFLVNKIMIQVYPSTKIIFSWGLSAVQSEKQCLTGLLQNSCSLIFREIHRKTLVPESLFQQSCEFQACNLLKRGLRGRYCPANLARCFRAAFLWNASVNIIASEHTFTCSFTK